MAVGMRWTAVLIVASILGVAIDARAQSPRRPFRLKDLLSHPRHADRQHAWSQVTSADGGATIVADVPANAVPDDCTARGGCTAPVVPGSPRFPPPPKAGDASVPDAAEYFDDPFAFGSGSRRAANIAVDAHRPLRRSRGASRDRAASASLRTPPGGGQGHVGGADAAYRLRALAGALNAGYSGPSLSPARRPTDSASRLLSGLGRVDPAYGAAPRRGFVSHPLALDAADVPWRAGENVVPAGALPPLPRVTPSRSLPPRPRVAPDPWPFRPDAIPY